MFLVQTKLLMQTSRVRVCVLQNSFGLVGTFSQRPAIQTITIHIVNCQFSILTLHFWPFLLLLQCLSQIKVSGTQRFQWSPSTSYTTSSATQAGNVRCNHTSIRQGIFIVIYRHLPLLHHRWLIKETNSKVQQYSWGWVENLLAWVDEWRIPTFPFSQTHNSCLWP